MSGPRCRKFAWLLVCAPLALLFASSEPIHAGSRGNQIGPAAAGFAIGVIIGSAISEANQAEAQQKAEGKRANCAGVFGPGAVNKAGSPGTCVCRTGYVWASQGNTKSCVARAPGGGGNAQASRGLGGPRSAELEKIQESLNLLGYDAGSVDGQMGQKTQQAILKYQAAKGFQQTGQLSPAEQQILFSDVAALRAPDQRRTPVPFEVEKAEADRKSDVRIELAHWETVRNTRNPAELEVYIDRFPSGEFTKLARLRLDQLRSELAKEEDRKSPPKVEQLAEPVAGSLPAIDAARYPKARQGRPDAVAVVIGNNAYSNGVPNVEYSLRDAEAMKLLLAKTLGIDSGNILFLKDATRGTMNDVFGTEANHKGKLWRLIDEDGRSDVFVFYSGHGVPSINEEGQFLLPVDGDPNTAGLSGYPLSLLYKNLEKLKTKSTTVFIDACFSGQAADGNATPLIKQASPVSFAKVTPSDPTKLNLFSAATERQLSSWDPEAGHGIFTRYVLSGLSGEADDNSDRQVTAKELQDYLTRHVRKTARRVHGREQEPQFSGNTSFVLSSF